MTQLGSPSSDGSPPGGVGLTAPPVPEAWVRAADEIFGEALGRARRYADLLVSEGASRGLIGPRERERIWERHLLNSAALALLVEPDATVADVGSGAGLPGIPLALARPDVTVTLVEPMERRCAFLHEVVALLALSDQVNVFRGRAPDCMTEISPVDCVVARAVAPLDRLTSWTMPLCRPGGRLLALRGRTAEHEIEELGALISRAGGSAPYLREVGEGLLPEVVAVVEVARRDVPAQPRGGARHARGHRPDRRFT